MAIGKTVRFSFRHWIRKSFTRKKAKRSIFRENYVYKQIKLNHCLK